MRFRRNSLKGNFLKNICRNFLREFHSKPDFILARVVFSITPSVLTNRLDFPYTDGNNGVCMSSKFREDRFKID